MAGAREPQSAAGPCNAAFDARPDEYDAMRAAGHMARRRREYFDAVVRSRPGPVLELGCGTGTLLRWLAAQHPDRSFLGVEPLAGYVDFARERARAAGLTNVSFAVGTAESLDGAVATASVGLVLSVDVLHHVRSFADTVREVARVIQPGGRWRAMEPNRLHPYVWLYHTLTEGERTFPVRRFLQVAAAGGWRLVDRENLFLVPSGVPRLPPWAERVERRWESFRPISGAVSMELARV